MRILSMWPQWNKDWVKLGGKVLFFNLSMPCDKEVV